MTNMTLLTGAMVEILPGTMCWPVNIENNIISGKQFDELWDAQTKAFFWSWTHDLGPHVLEHRLITREPLLGLYIGKSVAIYIRSELWPNSEWKGHHQLDLFFTVDYGILAIKSCCCVLLNPNSKYKW